MVVSDDDDEVQPDNVNAHDKRKNKPSDLCLNI